MLNDVRVEAYLTEQLVAGGCDVSFERESIREERMMRAGRGGRIPGGARFQACRGTKWAVLVAMLCLMGTQVGAMPFRQSGLDAAFESLRAFDWGPNRIALVPIDAAVVACLADPAARWDLEGRLVEVLHSAAPRGAKSYVCRQLSVMGTPRCIPAVTELLDDPELSHMARYALEAIPGPESVQALRDALPALPDELKAGVIGSLARRGDEQSVPILIDLLARSDDALAQSVVTAMGRIGTASCVEALTNYRPSASLSLEPLITDALLRIARRAVEQGSGELAVSIYTPLASSPHEHLRVAALEGLLRAQPDRRVARLTDALAREGSCEQLFAERVIRERVDAPEIVALTDAFASLPLSGQIGLLRGLARYAHPAVRAVAVRELNAPDASLRLAALAALGISGEPVDARALVDHAASTVGAESDLARDSLRQLPGSEPDTVLLQLLGESPPQQQIVVIRSLVDRRTPDAGPPLLALARSPDAEVRAACFEALEAIGDGSLAAELVELLLGTPAGKERELAERAVWRCCQAIAEPTRRADPLLAKLTDAAPSRRAILLPALGRVGGEQAVAAIDRGLAEPAGEVHDAAVRALCNWPDAQVAERLLELARNPAKPAHQIWAIRAFARVIARQGRDEPQRVWEGLHEVMQLATRVEDRQLILTRMTTTRVPEALEFASACLTDPALRAEAIETTIALADAMKDSHPVAARGALERVLLMTDNPELQLHLTKILWNMQQKGQ